MVTSHRGYTRQHPENSLAAFRAAADVGADFVEIDVRHTADDALVLMHDGSVDRTTDGAGDVSALTLAEIRELTLDSGESGNPESERVPTFAETLALAEELGVMLYIDQKTDRWDLVLAEIQGGAYYDQSMVRDSLETVAAMSDLDPDLFVMPFVEDEAGFDAALVRLPNLRIVEVSAVGPRPELCAIIAEAGLKIQQDVLGPADIQASLGNYKAWKGYIDAGVWLPSTDLPQLLAPAVEQYNATGVFPESGPGDDLSSAAR
ncbi:MAG: hypothetical protein C4523_21045 [Myxococcales bacterium]|nr:MAG: hypothetical protein C4523_21045 [Myxococcales bacterium]